MIQTSDFESFTINSTDCMTNTSIYLYNHIMFKCIVVVKKETKELKVPSSLLQTIVAIELLKPGFGAAMYLVQRSKDDKEAGWL